MDDRTAARHFDEAWSLAQAGNTPGAIEALQRALGADPEMAEGHAFLSILLLNQRRVHAAAHEAGIALALAPESAVAHRAAAGAAVAKRNFTEALAHAEMLLELEPENPDSYLLMASIDFARGTNDRLEEYYLKALALDGQNPDALAAYGDFLRRRDRVVEAVEKAREALSAQPQHADALVLMGRLLLDAGEAEAAREHARAVLADDPHDLGAIHLLSAVKARGNPVLGLWWRYHAYMEKLGQTRAVIVLLVAFLLYRIAAVAAQDGGSTLAAGLINWVWLALVAYTWVGPAIFQQQIKKEIEQVSLKPGF